MSKYIKLEDAEKLLTNALRIAQGFDEPLERSLAELPTIEVEEDCISREYMLRALNGYGKDWQEDCKIAETIRNAPSVVPKPKEGEWITQVLDTIYGRQIRLECSECGDVFNVTEKAFAYEKYCRYCGAKMK